MSRNGNPKKQDCVTPLPEALDTKRIAKAVKASLIGYTDHDLVDFFVKEVGPGEGMKLGDYVCTYLGFHIFKARMGRNLFHVYCERMIGEK